ncbi:cystatin-A-like isoform X4 [Erpetoichthys calabaricus]|uniref:cystatin-A-like isoform X4 n=1 Tax=Erpetoichthys calabaricus TaxID=27687 RepID=UPI002233E83D|nr:cystatin-A-like isoform X4 [Erpetoichthys calabaricus]
MAEEPGQWTDIKPADSNVKAICKEAQHDVEKQEGKHYQEFLALKYRSQLVNGTNYLIEVQVAHNECLHLKIHQSLPCYGNQTKVTGVQKKKPSDELHVF